MVAASLSRAPCLAARRAAACPARGAAARPARGAAAAPRAAARPNGAPSPWAAAGRAAAAVALSAALALGSGAPAGAALDRETFKAGAGATIESSDLTGQPAAEVVAHLREMLEGAQQRLNADTDGGYPQSVVQELDTVRTEIQALQRQLCDGKGCDSSNIKSAASGIEQQINALKALLGYD
jgi:hypothetical protein